MSKKKLLGIIGIGAAAVFGGLYAATHLDDISHFLDNFTHPKDGGTETGDLHFMIPVLNTENPQKDIGIINSYLRKDDIVIFPPNIYSPVSQLKKEISGLEIGTGGTNIDTLLPGISKIPKDVNYVTYDYEKDFTPEWTMNQTKTIDYFNQLFLESHEHGMKFIPAPVYVYGKDWDWGEVAKNADAMVIQVQNFQTGAKVPKEFQPSYIGKDLKQVTEEVVKEIKDKSPSTQIYLQFDTLVTDNPDNVLKDIATVKDLGIDGIALWYNPGTSGSTSKIDRLEKVLEGLER